MNAKTRPGLLIYSDEWMAEVATDVQEPLREIVQCICEKWQLGNSSDPNSIAAVIENSLMAQCREWEHQIDVSYENEEEDAEKRRWVSPDAIEFDAVSGYFYFKAGVDVYQPHEILARRRRVS